MTWSLKTWRRRRILKHRKIPETLWRTVVGRLPFLRGLAESELGRLKQWVILFLNSKQIHPSEGFALTDEMRLMIAAQACILILNLDLDYYEGWVEVIVYPDEFIPRREYTDEAGVVHVVREPMAGESWLEGPVLLSWADADRSGENEEGVNVVIHEFAHKLDMVNGDADGFPPLHRDMSRAQWTRVFGAAYADFCARVDAGEDTRVDPYASESPGEFFAVMSEAFFEIPRVVKQCYPEVYNQLRLFYRQDPASRMGCRSCVEKTP